MLLLSWMWHVRSLHTKAASLLTMNLHCTALTTLFRDGLAIQETIITAPSASRRGWARGRHRGWWRWCRRCCRLCLCLFLQFVFLLGLFLARSHHFFGSLLGSLLRCLGLLLLFNFVLLCDRLFLSKSHHGLQFGLFCCLLLHLLQLRLLSLALSFLLRGLLRLLLHLLLRLLLRLLFRNLCDHGRRNLHCLLLRLLLHSVLHLCLGLLLFHFLLRQLLRLSGHELLGFLLGLLLGLLLRSLLRLLLRLLFNLRLGILLHILCCLFRVLGFLGILLHASKHHFGPRNILFGIDQVLEHMLLRPDDARVL